MTPSPALASVRLALSEDPCETAIAASWIGPLVALGGLASRHMQKRGTDRQLVVVISVPKRDFAATLIGCGWVMNSIARELPEPVDVLRRLEPGTPVRVVTHNEVVADHFRAFDETKKPPRVRLTGSQWLVTSIDAVAVIDHDFEGSVRVPRPSPGAAARMARMEEAWAARLAAPTADLAIVGTLTWLSKDLSAFLTREGETVAPDLPFAELGKLGIAERARDISGLGGTLADLLLPSAKHSATWFTRLYASGHFSDDVPLPRDVRAVILDGAGAIKHLAEVEAPVVICILDRSVADETAAEMVVQLRNSRGEPVALQEELRWNTPAGIEALAFTVAL